MLDFDHAGIIKVYEEAKEKKLYDDVLLYTGRRVRHYGLTNHKEYFAERPERFAGTDFARFLQIS